MDEDEWDEDEWDFIPDYDDGEGPQFDLLGHEWLEWKEVSDRY